MTDSVDEHFNERGLQYDAYRQTSYSIQNHSDAGASVPRWIKTALTTPTFWLIALRNDCPLAAGMVWRQSLSRKYSRIKFGPSPVPNRHFTRTYFVTENRLKLKLCSFFCWEDECCLGLRIDRSERMVLGIVLTSFSIVFVSFSYFLWVMIHAPYHSSFVIELRCHHFQFLVDLYLSSWFWGK